MGCEDFADIPMSSLPSGMDYYAGGHWHEHDEFNYNGKPVVYPGSTEHHNIDSMEKANERGFIHYKGRPVFIKLKTRELTVKWVDCDGLTPEAVVDKCLSEVSESDKGLLVLRLKGRLSTGRRSDVNTSIIRDKAIDKGYIHCTVRISDLDNPEEVSVNARGRTVEEVEAEYLSAKGYNKNEISIARQLISLLGSEQKTESLARSIEEVLSLL
jgi:DNA repair exonuclease SbcCD nuclease subunit